MIRWELLTEETVEKIWDENLVKFADCSPFQTFSWGQYNGALGWKPCYFAGFNENNEITAMCLGLLRRYPFKVGLMWCVGGPIGDIGFWNEDLRKTALDSTKLKHLYFRFRCDRERDVKDVLFLNNADWTKTSFMMTSGMSMELDLTQSEGELFAGLDGNWRRNLNRAKKNNLIIKECFDPDIEELCCVFAEMEAKKNLPQLFTPEKLENLFKCVKDNLIFSRCENEEGELICFHAILIIGKRACHYFGAASDKGRKMSASFAVYWEMILQLKKLGITHFDLGGIDPYANPGVYTFKRETGARETESLGEWDWATSETLRLLGNWAIRRRQQTKPAKTKHKESPSKIKLPEWLLKVFGSRKNKLPETRSSSLSKNSQLPNES